MLVCGLAPRLLHALGPDILQGLPQRLPQTVGLELEAEELTDATAFCYPFWGLSGAVEALRPSSKCPSRACKAASGPRNHARSRQNGWQPHSKAHGSPYCPTAPLPTTGP